MIERSALAIFSLLFIGSLVGCASQPFYCDSPTSLSQSIACLIWRASAARGTISFADLDVLRRRASEGDIESQYSLGRYTFDIDREESWQWICTAAMGGHEDARVWTGLFFEYGLDPIEPDSVTAFMWYLLAEKAGSSYRKKLENELDSERIATATKMALEWRSGNCLISKTNLQQTMMFT